MEISDLRYFLAVAREESIKLASESLYISQPGLTKVIQRLEKELGKDLFIRSNRKITLTDDGILLRKRAQEIIDLVDKTNNEFIQTHTDLSGEVLIGGGESDGMKIITQTMKSLSNKYPKIHFQMYSGNGDIICERIDKGLLDFGVLMGVADLKKYDFIKLPYFDNWGILMKKDDPFVDKEYITLNDMTKMPIIFPTQTNDAPNLKNWFENRKHDLNIVAKYNLIYNAGLMVEEGIGNAFCIDNLINTTNISNLVFKPLKPKLLSNIMIIWKKYQVFSEPSKKFLEELKNNISNKLEDEVKEGVLE